MENEQWPADYNQQSADMIVRNREERTLDCLNNSQHFSMEQTGLLPKSDIKEDPDNGYEAPQNSIISEKGKQTIHLILAQIKSLNQNEKYFLYLKLPSEVTTVVDPFRLPLNPLGSRSEISRTIVWIQTHLEEDQNVSLPKKEVYYEYDLFCEKNNIKPLSQADFGKVMKQVFPKVRARRLGQRGNSKYCYSGLKRRCKLNTPFLPDLSDRPLSTEAPLAQASLTSAAWLIVKEWSQQQLGSRFASILQLAQYLVRNCSIGVGTEAANKLTLLGDNPGKGEETPCKSSISKHRETQLQLQKKLQQKTEGKERKRKNQPPSKTEPKPGSKKCRSQSVPTPTVTSTCSSTAPSPLVESANVSGGECSTSSSCGTNSTSVSPTQGKTICDKPELTQLPALPDFNSFQKADGMDNSTAAAITTGKGQSKQPLSVLQVPCVQENPVIPISRLMGLGGGSQHAIVVSAVSEVMPSPPVMELAKPAPPPPTRKLKYKAIQPRLQQPCDIAMYNAPPQPVLPVAVDPRSQLVHCLESSDKDKFKDNKGEDLDVCDDEDFPLTRERLNSVSNIEKDAMDEYLGTNNSQHEEELSKYFSNDAEKQNSVIDNTSKLSTLRQLLEQNGISEKKILVASMQNTLEPCLPLAASNLPPFSNPNPVLRQGAEFPGQLQNIQHLPSLHSNVRRRVSFETPEDAVPASPNTRSKNFNFTPISPGALSPNSIHSKCSSTSASPFISPRSTPNLRNKLHNIHKPMIIKKESDLTVEISPEVKNYISAPVSPMLPSNKSVLQNLLNSEKKVSYRPGYGVATNIPFNAEVTSRSHSIGHIPEKLVNISTVSSSSLLTQLLKNDPPDFGEDDLPDSEKLNVKGILSSLEEQHVCDNNNIDSFNMDLSSNNQSLSDLGLHLINPNVGNELPAFNQLPVRSITRSQSIDVNMSLDMDRCNPSRSVPGTPLPFAQNFKVTMTNNNKGFQPSSRSYPSTPLNANETFVYNSDCLLNGQPIRSDSMEYYSNFEMSGDNNGNSETKEFQLENDFGMIDNDNGLIDDSGILIQQRDN